MKDGGINRNPLWKKLLIFCLIVGNLLAAVFIVKNLQQKKAFETQFAKVEDLQEEKVEISFSLPETIYALTGKTMEIYNAQVSSLGEAIFRYEVLWNCEVGENLERKFSVSTEEGMEGSYPLKLEIYDTSLQLIASQECTLVIVTGDAQELEAAQLVTTIEELAESVLDQVKVCVDTKYNGDLEKLKPEGVAQMRDVVWAVRSGRKE